MLISTIFPMQADELDDADGGDVADDHGAMPPGDVLAVADQDLGDGKKKRKRRNGMLPGDVLAVADQDLDDGNKLALADQDLDDGKKKRKRRKLTKKKPAAKTLVDDDDEEELEDLERSRVHEDDVPDNGSGLAEGSQNNLDLDEQDAKHDGRVVAKAKASAKKSVIKRPAGTLNQERKPNNNMIK